MDSNEQRADSIFRTAIELPLEQREAFLDRVCSSPELRRIVESLLQVHDRAEQLLPTELSAPIPDATLESAPDDEQVLSTEVMQGDKTIALQGETTEFELATSLGTVGPYRLEKILGEGGMGAVYLATTSHPVKRTVALKLIKPGLGSSEVIARFESERQVLALMDHPGIARVLDAGETESGLPYFVMELVRGVPLTEYCNIHRLPIRERLKLFRDVCHAVQHAHQKGILHRDLKPSNILVASYDGRPTVKIIDFGLAKALETAEIAGTDLTIVGRIMGTPHYMSPEQADMKSKDIDTRTDIYSLGVILYELLTGTTPLTRVQSGLAELLRNIREVEPLAPSQRLVNSGDTINDLAHKRDASPTRLVRVIQGELDWIVMKAIDKDRERRYSSAGHLAEEINRYLNNLPVEAGPPSRRYRFFKFARRNKPLLIAGGLVLACLLLGLIGTTVGMIQASIAERLATDARTAETIQRRVAEDALQSEQAALKKSESLVSEMYDSRGDLAFRAGTSAQAALWFAHSAALPGKSEVERRLNLIQTKNAFQDSLLPVATFLTGSQGRKIRLAPSARFFAAYADDGVTVWDIDAIKKVDLPNGSRPDKCFDWHPQRDWIAIGGEDGSVRVIDVVDQTVAFTIVAGTTVTAVKFSNNGSLLAVGTSDVQVWSLDSQNKISTSDTQAPSIHVLSWSPSDTHLIFGGKDSKYSILNLTKTDTSQTTPIAGHSPLRTAPVWLNDQELFTAGYGSKTKQIRISRVEISALPHKVVDETTLENENCFAMTVSDDGKALGVAAYRAAYILNCDSLQSPPLDTLFSNEVRDIRFSPGTQNFIAGGRNSEAFIVQRRFEQPTVARLPHFGLVESVDAHRDQLHFATIQTDGMATIWRDARVMPLSDKRSSWGYHARLGDTGRYAVPSLWRESPRYGPSLEVNSIAIFDIKHLQYLPTASSLQGTFQDSVLNHDETMMAIAYRSGNETNLVIVDTSSGQPRAQPLPLRQGEVASLAFSPLNNQLALLHKSGAVGMIDADTMRILWSQKIQDWKVPTDHVEHHFHCVFSPDGNRLVAMSPGNYTTIHVMNTENGQTCYEPIKPVIANYHCRSISFSHDGKYLATVVNGVNAVRIWELDSGTEVAAPLLHPGDYIGIFQASFTPDDAEIITANFDGFVRQFDWRTGEASAPALQHPDEVFDAQPVGDGSLLATACRDGFWRLWHRTSGKLVCPPLQLGSGPDAGAPVSIAYDDRTHQCLVTGDHAELYVVDLSQLLETYPLSTSEQIQVAELASGKRIDLGQLTGMDREEWQSRWVQSQPTVDALIGATPKDEVMALLRSSNIAKQRKDEVREQELLDLALTKLPAVDTADESSLELLAEIVQRSVELSTRFHHDQHNKPSSRSSRDWSEIAEQLRKRVGDNSKSVQISSALAHNVSDAWLNSCEIPWIKLEPISVSATNGTHLEIQTDGSVRASGPRPDKDIYTTLYSAPEGVIRAIRLNALAVEENGTIANGRDPDRNFNLTQIELETSLAGTKRGLPFSTAAFSFGPLAHSFTNLFKPGLASGWHTHTRQFDNQWVLFETSEPIAIESTSDTVELSLSFNSQYPKATMRQYLVEYTTAKDAVLLELLRSKNREPNIRSEILLAGAHIIAGHPELADSQLTQVLQNTEPPVAAVALAAISKSRGGNQSAAQELLNNHLATSTVHIGNLNSLMLMRIALGEVLQISPDQVAEKLHNFESLRELRELDRLLTAAPSTTLLHNRRTTWHSRRQMWKEAISAARNAVNSAPDDRLQWLYLAPLLMIDHSNDYPQFAADAIQRFGNSTDVDKLHAAAWVSTLSPKVDGFAKINIDYALERVAAQQAPIHSVQYIYAGKAMISLRTGEHQEALDWAKKAIDKAEYDWVKGIMMMVSALALLEQDRISEAQSMTSAVDRMFRRRYADQPATRFDEFPLLEPSEVTHARLTVEVFRREFESRSLELSDADTASQRPDANVPVSKESAPVEN